MSRQIRSFHRSISHTANLQNSTPIIPVFAFPPPDSPYMNSDITVFHTISQFEHSDLETPDEFADSETSSSTFSEPSPSTFFKPPFQPIHSQTQCASPSTPSDVSQVTPTYSPFTTGRSTINFLENTRISYEKKTIS